MKKYIFYLMVVIYGSGCSLSRTLPEGAYLYSGSKVKIISPHEDVSVKSLKATYSTLLKYPEPSKKKLGVFWSVRLHNLFYTKKEKGLKHWFQKNLGKAPVIYDEQLTQQMEKVLENRAFNNGFFKVEVTSKVHKKKRSAKVSFEVKVDRPYLVAGVVNAVADSVLKLNINATQSASVLKVGEAYNLNLLKEERERIARVLRQKGYYYFVDDFLTYKADTIQGDRKVFLELALKEQVSPSSLKQQYIQKVYVYPDLNVKGNDQLQKDTLDYEGLTIVYHRKMMDPSMLWDAITIRRGDLYEVKKHQNSLERLTHLRNHQFIEIHFEPSPKADSLLQVFVRLTPRKKEAIEGSLGFSLKSGLYFGPEISLSYLHRNLFQGAEQLRLTTFGNYNYPLSSTVGKQQEYGLTLDLSRPGIVIPFVKNSWSENQVSTSKASFTNKTRQVRLPLNSIKSDLEEGGYTNLLSRLNADSTFAPFIGLSTNEFSIAYQWRKRPDIQQELTPVDLVLQIPSYEVAELEDLLVNYRSDNGTTEGSLVNLQNMLILKPSYIFLYDSRQKKVKQHNYFYRGKGTVAANFLLSSNNVIPGGRKQNQFFQTEQDFRYFHRFSSRQSIGFRFATSISFPLQKDEVLPFFDLYKIGGPISVRAFQPRQVGPGSVVPSTDLFFFSGTGDILLESSLEWRPKLTKLLELGFFLDAGNVWLFQGGPEINENAVFEWNNFYKQIATGAGMGLRLDFEILLLRFDFSFPLTKPWLPEGERFVGNEIDLGNNTWRKDNLTFYVAFGYSF